MSKMSGNSLVLFTDVNFSMILDQLIPWTCLAVRCRNGYWCDIHGRSAAKLGFDHLLLISMLQKNRQSWCRNNGRLTRDQTGSWCLMSLSCGGHFAISVSSWFELYKLFGKAGLKTKEQCPFRFHFSCIIECASLVNQTHISLSK